MTLRTTILEPVWSSITSAAVLWFPGVVGVECWWFGVTVEAQLLLPAVALTTAALMGLSAITFTRLKDAAATPRPESGPDPATAAYNLFRRVNRSALEAVILGAVCVVGICIGPRFQWLVSAVVLAGIAYVGFRLLLVLRGLRAEAERVIGDRNVMPSDNPVPHIKLAK